MTVTEQPVLVASRKVRAALDSLLEPDAKEWAKAAVASIPLVPTPVDRQPSAYVRASWSERPRGAVSEIAVSTLTNARALAVRLEWEAPRPSRRISDYNVYADACAVLFARDGRLLEHETMGSPGHPVEGWHWRAGTDEAFVINATGLGTATRVKAHSVCASSRWSEGRWQVVLARPLEADGVPLAKRKKVPVAFAVWTGVAGERAGLKSYSPQAHELQVGQ